MPDQDRLFRQIPNLLLEVIDQSLDGRLCKARIGTSTQLFCSPVQIWPLRNDNTVSFGLKEIAKAGPAIGGDPRAMDQHDGLRHQFRSDRMIDASCRLPLAFLVANGLTVSNDGPPLTGLTDADRRFWILALTRQFACPLCVNSAVSCQFSLSTLPAEMPRARRSVSVSQSQCCARALRS